MIKSYSRGNKIYYDGFDWRYSDDNSICDDSRVCVKCGKSPTKDGYDSCLGKIKDIGSACCGHGVEESYIIKINT